MVSRFDRFINTFLTDSGDGADKKPRRHRTVEPVGVGSPNPLGEATKSLRWMTHRKLCRIQPQRD